jgi:PGF-pre-PGF domain-containing protein
VIYTAGETLDLTGLVITLIKSDTSTEDVAFKNFAVKRISVSPENETKLEEGITQVIITHTDSGTNVTQDVTVNKASVPVTGISVTGSGNSTTVVKSKTLQMNAAVFPANASNKEIKWTVVSVNGTATITQAGLLTGTGAGIVTVTATAVDGSGEAGSLNIKVTEAPSITTPASGGAGGSGGGSQTTGENEENIALKDYSIKYVQRDTETVFEFRNENNSILSIGFTTRLNGGQTKTMIEMLKGTSTLIKKAAPGKVYRNVNIWVGDGKITQSLMSDATITFKVEKAWLTENSVDPASIKLLRYSKSWAHLPTSMTGEDETYVYYVAQTPGFSAFAISGMSEKDLQAVSVSTQEGSSSSPDEEGAQMSAADSPASGADNAVSQEPQSAGTITFLLVLAGISVIGVLSYMYKDNLSRIRMHLGNPDGKRYRRLKRI